MTKSANGFGGVAGADGEVARLAALSPKMDSTAPTIAVNGVTTACDTGATDVTDRAAGVIDVADSAAGATPDATVTAEAEDPAVLNAVAVSSGFVGVEETAGVAEPVAVFGLEVVAAPVGPAVAAEPGAGVDAGVDSEAGTVGDAVVAPPVGSVAGAVGLAVVDAIGSDVAGGAVDSRVEPPADVVEGGDAGVVGSEPELAAGVFDEVVDPVGPVEPELEVPVEMVVVDPELEPPTVVAEIVDDGEDVVVEVVPPAGEDVVRGAVVPSAAVLVAPVSVLELFADEVDPAAASVSAWATPEPLISAAPKPTVTAEVLTHVGTSWVEGARWRPRPDRAARAFALARFFTR